MSRFVFLFGLFIAILFCSETHCKAAFPIQKNQQIERKNEVHNTLAVQPHKYYNTHSEDMGVFGILAIIFAVTGLFPLAIASGIIGTQNGRKFKGLARAGLLFGILVGMVFAGYLLYLFVLG